MKKLLIGTLLVVGVLFVIFVSNPKKPVPVSAPTLGSTPAPTGPVYAVPPGATAEGVAAAKRKAPAQPPAKAKSRSKQTFTNEVALAAWYGATNSTPKEQRAGAKLVKSLMGEGVFRKLEFKDGIPTAWISRTFYGLSYEHKEVAIANAAAYYFWPNQSWPLRIHLRDARTGRKVGQFNRDGLQLD